MGLGPAGYLGYMPDNTIDLVTIKQLHPVEFPMDIGTDPGHGHSKGTLVALVAGARGRVPTARHPASAGQTERDFPAAGLFDDYGEYGRSHRSIVAIDQCEEFYGDIRNSIDSNTYCVVLQ